MKSGSAAELIRLLLQQSDRHPIRSIGAADLQPYDPHFVRTLRNLGILTEREDLRDRRAPFKGPRRIGHARRVQRQVDSQDIGIERLQPTDHGGQDRLALCREGDGQICFWPANAGQKMPAQA